MKNKMIANQTNQTVKNIQNLMKFTNSNSKVKLNLKYNQLKYNFSDLVFLTVFSNKHNNQNKYH